MFLEEDSFHFTILNIFMSLEARGEMHSYVTHTYHLPSLAFFVASKAKYKHYLHALTQSVRHNSLK